MSMSLQGCDTPHTSSNLLTVNEEHLVHQALDVLEHRLFQRGPCLQSSQLVRHYLRLQLVGEKNEVFALLFLDGQHRIQAFEILFRGTVDSAAVYARQIVQRALHHNSAAVILAHNHPSGSTQPSTQDMTLTQELKRVLDSIQVRVLDHFIIGEGEPYSFAEAGHL